MIYHALIADVYHHFGSLMIKGEWLCAFKVNVGLWGIEEVALLIAVVIVLVCLYTPLRWQSAIVVSCTEIPRRNLDVTRALPVEWNDTFRSIQLGSFAITSGNIIFYFIPYLYRHSFAAVPEVVCRGACCRRSSQSGGG